MKKWRRRQTRGHSATAPEASQSAGRLLPLRFRGLTLDAAGSGQGLQPSEVLSMFQPGLLVLESSSCHRLFLLLCVEMTERGGHV
jgi:hypothetical protein